MKTLSLPFALLALLAAASVHAAPAATEFKFQFGAQQAAPGYTLVPPSRQYAKEAGYGFEPGASVTTVSRETGDALHRGAVTGIPAVSVLGGRAGRQLSGDRHAGRS